MYIPRKSRTLNRVCYSCSDVAKICYQQTCFKSAKGTNASLFRKSPPSKKLQELEEQNHVHFPMILNLWTKPGRFIFICGVATPKHGSTVILEPYFSKYIPRNPSSASYWWMYREFHGQINFGNYTLNRCK